MGKAVWRGRNTCDARRRKQAVQSSTREVWSTLVKSAGEVKSGRAHSRSVLLRSTSSPQHVPCRLGRPAYSTSPCSRIYRKPPCAHGHSASRQLKQAGRRHRVRVEHMAGRGRVCVRVFVAVFVAVVPYRAELGGREDGGHQLGGEVDVQPHL
jgi:hypothetical protein